MCVPPLRRALPPEGERMCLCDKMAAAIDGARTLTRLDHLSRSIWQGLAADAVADDDAQALAERLHARRSILRGEIKPVGIPVGRPSIFPPRRLQRPPSDLWRLRGVGTSPPGVRCRRPWPASSRSASWRCCASSAMKSASTGAAIGAWINSRHELGCVAGWFRTRSGRRLGLGLLTVEERRREGRRRGAEHRPDRLEGVDELAGQGRAVEPPEGRGADRVQKSAPHGCVRRSRAAAWWRTGSSTIRQAIRTSTSC